MREGGWRGPLAAKKEPSAGTGLGRGSEKTFLTSGVTRRVLANVAAKSMSLQI